MDINSKMPLTAEMNKGIISLAKKELEVYVNFAP